MVIGWDIYSHIQHIPKQSAYLLQQWQRDPHETLLEGLTVGDPNLILNHPGAPKLIAVQHENIMETQHQLSCCRGIPRSSVAEPIQVQLFQKLSLLLTYRDSHLSSVLRTASISRESSISRTGDVDTTLATCTPFFRKTRDSNIFLTMMDTLLQLILSLVYVCRACSPGGSGHDPQVVKPQSSRVSP